MIAIPETVMRRVVLICLATFAVAAGAQPELQEDNTSVLLGRANMDLATGSVLIQAGDYEEGIDRTLRGLDDRGVSRQDRSAGLSNVCAAYAAQNLPQTAVRYCTESLIESETNWRAYSNRSYAYWLLGRYDEAYEDLEAAARINPRARQIAQIRGMINERRYRPNVIMEDLQ
jgi:tetratricopeptide (TPR) repeat protein